MAHVFVSGEMNELNVARRSLCWKPRCEPKKSMDWDDVVHVEIISLNTELHCLLQFGTRDSLPGKHDPFHGFYGHAHTIRLLLIQGFERVRICLIKVPQWTLQSTLDIFGAFKRCQVVEIQLGR